MKFSLFASFFVLSACAIICHQVINISPLDGHLGPPTLLFVDIVTVFSEFQ